MKKNLYIIIGLAIVVVIVGWLVFSSNFWQTGIKENNIVLTEKEVMLVIDDGKKEPITFKTDFIEGMSAFYLLKEGTDKLVLGLKIKVYDIGVFVEAIGDTENGQDGKYWLYYVNGEMPMVAADKIELKAGDKVEFKFEKSTF